jgi:xanthine dioxygenase
VTGNLHFQVHAYCVSEITVDPLPEDCKTEGALYSRGAHLKDLKEVRELLYRMQRPAIAPKVRYLLLTVTRNYAYDISQLVYPHDWHEKDLLIFQ